MALQDEVEQLACGLRLLDQVGEPTNIGQLFWRLPDVVGPLVLERLAKPCRGAGGRRLGLTEDRVGHGAVLTEGRRCGAAEPEQPLQRQHGGAVERLERQDRVERVGDVEVLSVLRQGAADRRHSRELARERIGPMRYQQLGRPSAQRVTRQSVSEHVGFALRDRRQHAGLLAPGGQCVEADLLVLSGGGLADRWRHRRALDERFSEPFTRVGCQHVVGAVDESQLLGNGSVDAQRAVGGLPRQQPVVEVRVLRADASQLCDLGVHVAHAAQTRKAHVQPVHGQDIGERPQPLDPQHGVATAFHLLPWSRVAKVIGEGNAGAQHRKVARRVADVRQRRKQLAGKELVAAIEAQRIDARPGQVGRVICRVAPSDCTMSSAATRPTSRRGSLR
jgi:hypothetical protein